VLGRGKAMTIFVITVLVPACIFCVVVLVNFQREILNAKRNRFPAAKIISLDRAEGFFDEPQLGYENDDDFFIQQSRDRDEEPMMRRGSVEIVQLESAYFGPFFIIPARKRRAQKHEDVTSRFDRSHDMPFPTRA
jgi:hypothetical protein